MNFNFKKPFHSNLPKPDVIASAKPIMTPNQIGPILKWPSTRNTFLRLSDPAPSQSTKLDMKFRCSSPSEQKMSGE